jgi:hypothetical protein
MDKNYFEFLGAMDQQAKSPSEVPTITHELSDLQLALVGGGIGDTIL